MPSKMTPQAKASMSQAQKMPPKLRLTLANECEDLSKKVKLTSSRKENQFYVLHSKQMDVKNYGRMMTLFESLMREIYENSSWGWNEQEKMAEWKHQRTRVILVFKRQAGDPSPNVVFNHLPEVEDDDELVAFMCIRFECGGSKSECALYVYELHVHRNFQRQGLGDELMRMARCFATEFRMDKVMLTSFRSNTLALQFYKKLKFIPDKSSPAKNEADYVILSSKVK